MKNYVVVVCSARHLQFANLYCQSILDTESISSDWDFIFVINQSSSYEDLKLQVSRIGIEDIENVLPLFIEKAKRIGKVYYNEPGGFELGALKFSLSKISKEAENIILMQCTYEIKDKNFFTEFFDESYKNHLLGFNPVYQNYFCKYPVKILNTFLESGQWIETKTKTDAVYNEGQYISILKKLAKDIVFKDKVLDISYSYQERFGRKNQIEDTLFTRKWKGVWHASMIKDCWK